MNSTFTINNGNRIMKPKHAMDAIANSPRLGPWKAILAILGLLSMLPSGQAQTITPLQCGATATYYDTTGFYDCVHKCLDPLDPDGPSSCDSPGGPGGSGSPGSPGHPGPWSPNGFAGA